jgi:hypothetical protein
VTRQLGRAVGWMLGLLIAMFVMEERHRIRAVVLASLLMGVREHLLGVGLSGKRPVGCCESATVAELALGVLTLLQKLNEVEEEEPSRQRGWQPTDRVT